MSHRQRAPEKRSEKPGCFPVFMVLFLIIFLGSCIASKTGIGSETPPYFPRTYVEDVSTVVIRDISIHSVKTVASPVLNKGSRVAVLNFKSPGDSQGGVLISDIFASLLIRDGYQVVEREKIEKLLKEQDLIDGGGATISDLDIAERLGNLASIDYMVLGAVTLYESEAQSIYLPIKIREEDRIRYQDQYVSYRDWYIDHFFPFSLDYFKSDEEKLKILRVENGVWSLAEIEEELKKRSVQEFRVIATVGITAKIIHVSSGAIIWTGQAETVDFTLVDGAKRILEGFIKSVETTEE